MDIGINWMTIAIKSYFLAIAATQACCNTFKTFIVIIDTRRMDLYIYIVLNIYKIVTDISKI